MDQDKLKSILNYDPETGSFKWIISPSRKVRAGDIAGCVEKNYKVIGYRGKNYLAHRLAWLYMTGIYPEDEIDHINGIGTDNRLINLRNVSKVENNRNKRLPSNNTSGISGVYWAAYCCKWRSQITIERSIKHLGYFGNLIDAVCARKNAEIEHGFHKNHGSRR